ncbi:MAG: putative transcriptional regulator [Acidobacteria bacterium]|jgi:ArsR family transcriptional regulator|nr:putative transcriptional regulator [Acidobacteriota bacterium]
MKKEKPFNLELFFAALADRTRLRLLNLMREGEVCVCFFAETLGTNNPKISRHLSYLKRAELVSGRRDGKWMHYRISEPKNKKAAEIFAGLMEMLKEDKEMQIDRERLNSVCCAPPQPVQISAALRSKRELV